MELIVINSAGPMASTILGSIIEHCGYLNLPVRKRDLHGYLLGNRTLNDPFFKERTLKILEDMAEVKTGGGTSVIDRNAALPIKRTNLGLISENIKEYKAKKFRSIDQMYIESNELIRKAVIYKKVRNDYCGMIEYPTDLEEHHRNAYDLYRSYNDNFESVKFFHMHRNFWSWLNSLASQCIASQKFNPKFLTINLESIKNRYERYESCVSIIPGKNIYFDDLFLPKTKDIIPAIEKEINKKLKNDLEKMQYDLYGKVTDFQTTFTKADDQIEFLSKSTIDIFDRLDNYKIPVSISKYLFEFFYLKDFLKFKIQC